MKNGRFETQAEIYRALLDGNKISCGALGYVYFCDGHLTDEAGSKVNVYFTEPNIWSLYEEPRTPEDRLKDIEYAIKEIKSFLNM